MYVDIEINPELEKNIVESIPKEYRYSGLKKAVYVYVQLCRTLNYSMDYFVGDKKAVEYFTDPKNIKDIDGVKNKDVVCYVFNAILMKLYKKLDLLDEINENGYEFTDQGKFVDKHITAQAQIASFWSDFDGTKGRIKDNDLTALKYADRKPTGWTMHYHNTEKYFNEVIEEVIQENPIEMTSQEEYLRKVSAKFEGKQQDFPISERVDLFLRSIDIADYELFGFNNLIVLYDLLFSKEERDYHDGNNDQDVYFKIVQVKNTKELVGLLYFKNDEQKKEDKLNVYEISVLNQNYKKIDVDEVIKRIDSHYYTRKHGEELEYPEVVKEYLALQME